jgi:hypothetical protein
MEKQQEPGMVLKSDSDLYGEGGSVGFTYRGDEYYIQRSHTVYPEDGVELGRIELQVNQSSVVAISVSAVHG